MRKLARFLFWTAVVLGVVGGVLRLTLFRPWTLPDDLTLAASVGPTLAGGDVVLVLTKGTPGFGDLVRCADPEDATRFVVGRIAGLDGDLVETEGATLLVNGKRYEGEMACNEGTFTVAHPTTGADVQLVCDVVNMGGGWHYRGHINKPAFHSLRTKTNVGRGMVYLLSDDRDFHDDSRDFGPLPAESCKERIVVRLVSKLGWTDSKSRLSYIH